MDEFISFKRMITPIIIQVLFWIVVVVVILAGVVTLVNGEVLAGLAVIIFGPIIVRIYAEILIVMFRINETLTEVSDTLRQIEGNTRSPGS